MIGHVAVRPRFEAVIAACEVGDHLPPAAELANRIVQSDQVFITGARSELLEPGVHIVCRYSGDKDRRSDGNESVGVAVVEQAYHHKRDP